MPRIEYAMHIIPVVINVGRNSEAHSADRRGDYAPLIPPYVCWLLSSVITLRAVSLSAA